MGKVTVKDAGADGNVAKQAQSVARPECDDAKALQSVAKRRITSHRSMCALTKQDWLVIRDAIMTEGRAAADVARRYELSASTIRNRRRRERWSDPDEMTCP
jgi:hypothetical protein